MKNRSIRHRALLLAAPAVLSACSSINPMVTWKPGLEADPGIDTMPVARKDAEDLKATLQTRANDFVGDKAALNNTLLGLGVLTLGLATGKVHRDAYTATAGVAGSAFLFGNQNLQPTVLTAYQDGIGAVNCAVAAVRPMQIGTSTLADVKTETTSLRAALPTLAKALARADVALANTTNAPPALATAAQQQIDVARATYIKGSAANSNAAELPQTAGKVAGGLKGALSEIHRMVNEQAAKGVADSTAVVASLKSLVSIITGFGKNVGVDVLSKPATAGNTTAAGGAQSDTGDGKPSIQAPAPDPERVTDLLKALEALADANASVAVLADPLTKQLDGFRNFSATDELVKCKVTNAASAFSIDRPQLDFTANDKEDQTARIVASGGTTPYVGRFRDSPTFGIEVINPHAHDRTFEVKVPKTVKAGSTLTLSIMDGATPPNERLVTVRLIATPTTATTNQSDLGNDPLTSTLRQARDNGAPFTFGTGTAKTTYTVMKVETDTSGRAVTLACKPVPAAAPTKAQVREELLRMLVGTFKLPQATADTANSNPNKLTLIATAGCVK